MSLARVATAGLPVLALVLTGCEMDLDRKDRPSQTMPVSVEAPKAELARVELHMKVGDLNVSGGAKKLIEGDLSYLEPDKPTVESSTASFRASVVINQKMSGRGNSKGKNYRWDLKLSDATPVDLAMDFGVGQGQLNLGSLDLRSLEVRMGVGELMVDLRGAPKHDYTVNIKGGVGQAKIYLPASAGVIADAKGGIGGVNVRGLEKRDGRYYNKAYGSAKTTIRVDVSGGVGEIELIAEER